MKNEVLIGKVRIYCKEKLQSSRCKDFPFHNWRHTEDVVSNSKLISTNEKLTEKTVEEIIIASYFHDIGNIITYVGHEKVSCAYAQEFLTNEGYSEKGIMNVINNIKATEIPQHPKTISQKVICDSDLAHLGSKKFSFKNGNLRKEWEKYNNLTFTNEQWAAMNINFLDNHSYHTDFAKKYYSEQKVKNIERVFV